MVKIDWDAAKRGSFSPGVYHVQVGPKTDVRHSKNNGDAYLNLQLLDPSTTQVIAYDILMLEGAGLGMGAAKLRALGFDESSSDVEPVDVIGRRAYVALKEDEYDGKVRLKVDHSASDHCGYWHDPPVGMRVSNAVSAQEETPF